MTAVFVLLAGAIAFAIARILILNADRFSLVDIPNARSSHSKKTPRGGGMGIVVAGTIMGVYLSFRHGWAQSGPILASSVLIATTGFVDDLYSLSARSRLAVQLLACGLLMVGALHMTWPSSPANWISLGLLLVAGIWWINLFNFMDGIDGLAGSQSIFMLLAGAAIAALVQPSSTSDPGWLWMILVAAGTGGFLVLNWPPARIFMGDVGSTYLGFMIFAFAAISVSSGWLRWSTWMILGTLFLVDATLTLLRRIAYGEKWHAAHRSHAYQRLSRRWQSHLSVVLLFAVFNVLWLMPLAFSAAYWNKFEYVFVALSYLPATAGVLYLGGGKPDAAK